MNEFDWSDIAIFIAAPRELSPRRFTQIVKHYLPKGNIVLGLSEEEYVVGFEGQPQFEMLRAASVAPIIEKIAQSDSPNKIYTLSYSQNDLPSIVKKLQPGQRVLLVNGSWKYAFHNSEAYKVLSTTGVPMKFVSPFADEDEAKAYLETHEPFIDLPPRGTLLSENDMFVAAEKASLQSFDYSFQTGVALGKRQDESFEMLLTAFNRVVPYQTYAMHHGNSREKHLSPPSDTNHYDTIHAEMALLVDAAKRGIDLDGTTMVINLLPCPNCARTLSQTGIEELIYRHDHSGGYAKEILELCGKKVKRVSEV